MAVNYHCCLHYSQAQRKYPSIYQGERKTLAWKDKGTLVAFF
jgi:hypothetical protein